jgi:hypothetical protein
MAPVFRLTLFATAACSSLLSLSLSSGLAPANNGEQFAVPTNSDTIDYRSLTIALALKLFPVDTMEGSVQITLNLRLNEH